MIVFLSDGRMTEGLLQSFPNFSGMGIWGVLIEAEDLLGDYSDDELTVWFRNVARRRALKPPAGHFRAANFFTPPPAALIARGDDGDQARLQLRVRAGRRSTDRAQFVLSEFTADVMSLSMENVGEGFTTRMLTAAQARALSIAFAEMAEHLRPAAADAPQWNGSDRRGRPAG